MAYPIEAPFGGDTYALLSRCAECGKPYDGNDIGWTTTVTFDGSMARWGLFCRDGGKKRNKGDDAG